MARPGERSPVQMNDRHDAREGVEQNPAYRWTLPLFCRREGIRPWRACSAASGRAALQIARPCEAQRCIPRARILDFTCSYSAKYLYWQQFPRQNCLKNIG